MKYKKVLVLSRYHDDMANPIYNAYLRGIASQIEYISFIDYFDHLAMVGKKEFESQVLELLEKEKIDLIFTIFVSGDPILDPYFLQKIAKKRFMAMVFWDTEQFYEQIDRYYAQLADLVILPANYEYVHKLNLIGVNAICPFSLFDSTKYKPIDSQTLDSIDVSFVGEVTKGKRQEYLEYLQDNGIKVESYGVGTKNGKVSFSKVVEIFNRSKINLSFTGTYDNSVYTYCSNINNRIKQNKGKPIEIALCGGFVLTEYVPGIERVFPKESIDTFLSKEELLEKVKHYLQDDVKRESMRQKSFKHALKNYDSIEAFKQIFSTIESIEPKEEKRVILDTIFLKVHTTFHIFSIMSHFMSKEFQLMREEIAYVLKRPHFIAKDIKAFFLYSVRFLLRRRKFIDSLKNSFALLKEERVVIYGAGVHTTNLFHTAPFIKELNIQAIADQDSSLWGKKRNGFLVIAPEEIDNYAQNIIISSAKFEQEIKESLESQDKDYNIITLYDNFTEDLVRKPNDPYQIYRNTLKLR